MLNGRSLRGTGRFSGLARALAEPRIEKPLKRFNNSYQRTITPLKRGVNETWTASIKNYSRVRAASCNSLLAKAT